MQERYTPRPCVWVSNFRLLEDSGTYTDIMHLPLLTRLTEAKHQQFCAAKKLGPCNGSVILATTSCVTWQSTFPDGPLELTVSFRPGVGVWVLYEGPRFFFCFGMVQNGWNRQTPKKIQKKHQQIWREKKTTQICCWRSLWLIFRDFLSEARYLYGLVG